MMRQDTRTMSGTSPLSQAAATGFKVVRGYFALGDTDHVVHVTSSADFTLSIWARNVETFHGGVQILTPPSQFRTTASTGPHDGLVLDVPPQTGLDLGCIGARHNEVIDISNVS